MKIAYFVHDLHDPAVARRRTMFQQGGADALVLGFARDGQTSPATSARLLGITRNGHMLQRALSVLGAWAKLLRTGAGLKDCDVVVARNLEMLVLAVTSLERRRLRLPVVYECLDIHRLLSGEGLKSTALQILERWLLQHCRLLIVSSELFVTEHFDKHYSVVPPVLLVENKVLASETRGDSSTEGEARPPGPVLRVGWFGILRCRRTLLILDELASLMPDRLEIVIRGRPARDAIPDFDLIVSANPSIHFGGPYDRTRDLASLYSSVDLVWAIDFYEEGANSEWLLPNRLYESVLYRSIPLASSTSGTGRWLRQRGFETTADDCSPEALHTFLTDMDATAILDARTKLAAIPIDDVVCDSDQARFLIEKLPRRSALR